MNPNDNIVQQLKSQIKDLSLQIGVLSVKKNDAELTAQKFGQELETLHNAHRLAAQQLKELESGSCNMWENIGEGG